jgi:hypothetical protein
MWEQSLLNWVTVRESAKGGSHIPSFPYSQFMNGNVVRLAAPCWSATRRKWVPRRASLGVE